MNRVVSILVVAVATLAVSPAFAHHSRAMFDQDKRVTLVGTVKEFQRTNRRYWIQVPGPDKPDAAPVEWGVEMNRLVALMSRG